MRKISIILALVATVVLVVYGQVREDNVPTVINHEAGQGVNSQLCQLSVGEYDAADYDRVLEDFDSTETLVLEGSAWDNTLVRNCFIHDTKEEGILLRDVENVTITNCRFHNIGGQAAIRGSISGGTKRVVIDGNNIQTVAANGINFGQRSADDVDHQELKILNNTLSDSGVRQSSGLTHALYIQVQDVFISGNHVTGTRDGNGISVRSSGEILCNTIEGESVAGKPGIRYYPDHQTGDGKTLLFSHNTVSGQVVGIDLFEPVARYDGQAGVDHVVKTFVFTGNNLTQNDQSVRIADEYASFPFSITELP